MTGRPILFIDVDGPLNPYGARPSKRPEGYGTHRLRPEGYRVHESKRPLRVWLNPSHGPALLDLPFDLVWATTWAHEANEMIGSVIGLPELPFIEWPPGAQPKENPYWRAAPTAYWKTRFVVEYAAGRPFAWVDDEVTELDNEYVQEHHDGPFLLLEISPRLGLLESDFMTLRTWAEKNSGK